jgi:hypothetical protein
MALLLTSGRTTAAELLVTGHTAAKKYAKVYPPCLIARGRVPLGAQVRVIVPC